MFLSTQAIRNVQASVITALLNGGYLRIYGAPRPAAPEVAVTTQLLFAELRFASPAFSAPADGVAVANPFGGSVSILQSGIATWFRAFQSDGATAVLDGDVGEDLILSQPVLAQGGSLSVTSLTYELP
jgi:hypothetical protein